VCCDGAVLAHQAVVARASRFLRQLLLQEAICGPGDTVRPRSNVSVLLPDMTAGDLANFCSLLYLGER
jgi:hypothetical protein